MGVSRRVHRVLGQKPEEGEQLEDEGADGRIALKWILEKWDGVGMDWINLAQDRSRWHAVVNAVMNLRVP
jgi:hypothetical protein